MLKLQGTFEYELMKQNKSRLYFINKDHIVYVVAMPNNPYYRVALSNREDFYLVETDLERVL